MCFSHKGKTRKQRYICTIVRYWLLLQWFIFIYSQIHSEIPNDSKIIKHSQTNITDTHTHRWYVSVERNRQCKRNQLKQRRISRTDFCIIHFPNMFTSVGGVISLNSGETCITINVKSKRGWCRNTVFKPATRAKTNWWWWWRHSHGKCPSRKCVHHSWVWYEEGPPENELQKSSRTWQHLRWSPWSLCQPANTSVHRDAQCLIGTIGILLEF